MATLQNLGGQLMQIMLIALLVVSALVGMNRGLVIGIYAVLRNAIVVVSSIFTAPVVKDFLPKSWGDGRLPIALIIVVVLMYVIVHLLCMWIRLGDNLEVKPAVDKSTGLILGLIVGLILSWGALLLFGALSVYPAGEAFAKGVRNNNFDMWMQGMNPLVSLMKGNGFLVI